MCIDGVNARREKAATLYAANISVAIVKRGFYSAKFLSIEEKSFIAGERASKSHASCLSYLKSTSTILEYK